MKTLKLDTKKYAEQLKSKLLDLESEKNRKLEQLVDREDLIAQLRKQIEELQHELADEKVKGSAKFLEVEQKASKKISHLKYFHEHIMKRLQKSTEKFGVQLEDKMAALQREREAEVERMNSEVGKQLQELEANRKKKADHLR